MQNCLFHNAQIVSDNQQFTGSILLKNGRIEQIFRGEIKVLPEVDEIIDCLGLLLLPGVIDDQVHFREPGLTHKGTISSESRAAIAGGVTSFMEMPNTIPQTTTNKLLLEKHEIARKSSFANFSFYLGATNDNIDELIALDKDITCGVKIFMGSSTGNMLVDNIQTLERIFSNVTIPVAVHCEDEEIIQKNIQNAKLQFGEDVPLAMHPVIRSSEACYKSSSLAVSLAKKYNTRLHILHLSTKEELELLEAKPLEQKRITAEVCVHHLWFDQKDYSNKGSLIKWNPAIKAETDKLALRQALLDNKIDVIATDHAPHTLEEKNNKYFSAPSGAPLVQHSLVAMLELSKQGVLSLEQVVEKMCHAPARLFNIKDRGYIKEGFYADIVLVDPNSKWTVTKNNVYYSCGWSPLDDTTFSSKVLRTYVNGNLMYDNGTFSEFIPGLALEFNR